MEIRYLGHASFKITTNKKTIVTDPFDPSVGFPFPKVEADMVTVSHQHQDHNNVAGVKGNPFVIDSPGEYETKGIDVRAWSTFHDAEGGSKRGGNMIIQIRAEDIDFLHCGDLGHKLDPEVLDELTEIEILAIPVGGFYTIGPREAAAVIGAIEPKIILPMHYLTPKHDPKIFAQIKPVEEFLEVMGVESEKTSVLKVSKSSMPNEMRVVILERVAK